MAEAGNPTKPTSLKGAFQRMIPGGPEIVQGTVISVSPLQIRADGDSKLLITASSCIIPRHLTNYTTTASISGGSVSGRTNSAGDPSHSHSVTSLTDKGATITVNNALAVGDTVYMLALNSGKLYYVLDRT